ncbi:hypothetical protein NVIRPANT_00965 [Pantoea sp. Nvir]|nr:hypothetical protein NVIRPANT_00965 [Pantoea sp. Nvir]
MIEFMNIDSFNASAVQKHLLLHHKKWLIYLSAVKKAKRIPTQSLKSFRKKPTTQTCSFAIFKFTRGGSLTSYALDLCSYRF